MSQRDYNHVYTVGPVIFQIMQKGQHKGLCIDLIPCVTLAVKNNACHVALGFNWIAGTVNIGIMTKMYQQAEKDRIKRNKEMAKKQGITPRQYELRWGW